MRSIHLADPDNRGSHVAFVGVQAPRAPTRVAPGGGAITFRRFIAAGDGNIHEALTEKYGADYGEALVAGDPEVDLELIGRPVGGTMTVWLDADGHVLRCAPRIVEVLLGPDGVERERRDPVDVPSNIDEGPPVRWTKTRLKRAEAVRRFAFSRTVQLVHVDGLTRDYLHGLASRLDAADEVVLLAAGPNGRDPLVFQLNGVRWRAFLEGRVDGPRYQLLLRLSNLELKAPGAQKPSEATP